MDAKTFDIIYSYVGYGVCPVDALAAVGLPPDTTFTPEQAALLAQATARAKAELIKALHAGARGLLKIDLKTTLLMLSRMDPSWMENASEGNVEAARRDELLVEALRRKGWTLKSPPDK